MDDTKSIRRLADEAKTQYRTLCLLKRAWAPLSLRERTADHFIDLYYAWQRAKYGRVRRTTSRSALLR